MPRILVDKSNQKLKREYRLRFFALLFWMISLSLISVLIFVLPSYSLLGFYKKTYQTKGQEKEQVQIKNITLDYEKKLEATYQLSQRITSQSSSHVDIIKMLDEYALGVATVDALELSGEGNVVTITMRGRSLVRDNLLTFEKRIMQNSRFKDFNLPIESLTKREDLSFNITFTYHAN